MVGFWFKVSVVVTVLLVAGAADGESANPSRQYFEGQLIVASPDMPDPRFADAVILMVRHDAGGALGLIINQPIGTGPLHEFMERLNIETANHEEELTLFYGGPVHPDQGFVIHTTDYSIDDTKSFLDLVGVTRDRKVLKDIAAGKGPKKMRVIMGYAGWAAGQLEAEFLRGDWTVTPLSEQLIFSPDHNSKWQRAKEYSGLPL